MIIKCKICGGEIEFSPGDTFGQCSSCGNTSTIPKAEEEQKLNRYNRANHYRRQGEFDKAVTAYERILDEDDTDAEAHWGAVLSRYGIEYVEDPASGKRIPTCHRVQMTSVLADEDYLAALEYAPDMVSRNLYEDQAKEIAEIQKGILAISASEEPYDVFICYKDTDENRQRTKDSVLAQEIYYGLTEEGYKVFFSRITLEDKLGREYEPYIFAALNSARVMLVIGTKPEYINAVWVRNEWSRFLQMMKTDRKRLVIPCYRDMDPYDLPDELGNFQSQDMGRIGFLQDLLRNIRKVLDSEKMQTQPAQYAPQVTAQAGTIPQAVPQSVEQTAPQPAPQAPGGPLFPGASSLLKRAKSYLENGENKTISKYLNRAKYYLEDEGNIDPATYLERAKLILEDGDYKYALKLLNRVIDRDPENSEAYAARACATFGIRKESDLGELPFLFGDNPDWQKAMYYASPEQKTVYNGYIAKVRERVPRQIRQYAMDCAMEMAVRPGTDRAGLEAELEAFRIASTQSAGKRADGRRRANGPKCEAAFKWAVSTGDLGEMTASGLKTAADMFEKVGDDEAKEYAKQSLALAEQVRQAAIYERAQALYTEGQKDPNTLDRAAKLLAGIPEFRDAKILEQQYLALAEEVRRKAIYEEAKALYAQGQNDPDALKKAAEKLKRIPGFKDAESLERQYLAWAEEARQKKVYDEAQVLYSQGQKNSYALLRAAELFKSIPEFGDAKEMEQRCREKAEEIRAGRY